MRVLRIEHPSTRQGPYNPGTIPDAHREALYECKALSSGSTERHPCPELDEIDVFVRNYHYSGFANEGDLLEWFGPADFPSLGSARFHVATYEVPDEDVKVGRRQVAFSRDSATRISSVPCMTFLRLHLERKP